jgi:putative adhesin
MFSKISGIIKFFTLGIFLFSISINGMVKNQGIINQLLKTAHENKGKVLLAFGALATTAALCYRYWPRIKKSLKPIQNLVLFNNNRIDVSGGGRVVINGVEYGGNFSNNNSIYQSYDTSCWNYIYIDQKNHIIPMHAQKNIIVDNINGDIEVDTHNLPYLLISITKKAATPEDLNNIGTDISTSIVSIKTKLQTPLVKALINYKLNVPQDYKLDQLDIKTINGNIGSKNVQVAQVKANTTSGSIKTECGDTVEAENVSGNISLKNHGNCKAKSTSGWITGENLNNFDVTNINGKISVMNLNHCNAKSTSGSIQAENVNIFTTETSSGHIKVKNSNDADLKTNHGNIDAENIKATKYFYASSTSGSISVRTETLNCPCILSTTNGTINLFASVLNAKVRLKTTNGSIRNDFPLNNKTGSKKKFTVEIGAATHKLDLSTTNGNIRLIKQ